MPNIEKLNQERLIKGLENKIKEKDEIINRMIGIKEKGE